MQDKSSHSQTFREALNSTRYEEDSSYCRIQKVAIIFQRRFLSQSHLERRDNVHGSPSGGPGGCPHEEPFLEFGSVGCAPVSHLYRARVRLRALRTRLGSPLRYCTRQKLLETVAESRP